MCGVIIIGGELLAWWSWVQTEGHNITNGLFVVVVVVVVFTKYHFKKIRGTEILPNPRNDPVTVVTDHTRSMAFAIW